MQALRPLLRNFAVVNPGFFKLKWALELPGRLVKTQIIEPYSQNFWLFGLDCGWVTQPLCLSFFIWKQYLFNGVAFEATSWLSEWNTWKSAWWIARVTSLLAAPSSSVTASGESPSSVGQWNVWLVVLSLFSSPLRVPLCCRCRGSCSLMCTGKLCVRVTFLLMAGYNCSEESIININETYQKEHFIK